MKLLAFYMLRTVVGVSTFISLTHGAAFSSLTLTKNKTSTLKASLTIVPSSTASSNQNGSAIYHPLFAQYRDSTPKFINSTQQNVNPLVPAALGLAGSPGIGRRDAIATLPDGACAPGTPCVNGACCSSVR